MPHVLAALLRGFRELVALNAAGMLSRWSFAFAALCAVVFQVLDYSHRTGQPMANALSFFTIQSNCIAVAALVASPRFGSMRGAATAYVTIAGIVYALVLGGLYLTLTLRISWDNVMLHELMPAYMLLFWYRNPPALGRSGATVALWLAYPLLYLAYTLVRGSYTHWYPYAFLNPKAIGPAGVAVVATVIAGLCVWLSNALLKRAAGAERSDRSRS